MSLIVMAGVIAAAFFYGSIVVDTVRAAFSHPTAQLQAAEQRIDLTWRGQQIFYATEPAIEDKTAFNKSCESTERSAAILGCYFKDRIYLYNIQNTELDGTLEVTAAHELLHAGYHRLNVFERQRVDTMVTSEYAAIKDDPAIKQAMQYYQKAEPGAEIDELHSIIGTTVGSLPHDLEQYYATYFTDRAAVVALNAKYNAVFGELSKQADALQQKINTEGPQLKSYLTSYDADLKQLNIDISSFNTRASNGGFTSESSFATARQSLEARVDVLNGRREVLNAQVNTYNADVAALNALAIHVNQLNQSINGADAPSGV